MISARWHAQALASPQRLQVVEECAAKLVRMAAIAEQVVGPSDLPATLEVLTQAAAGSNTGMLGQLVSLATAKRAPKYAPPYPSSTAKLVLINSFRGHHTRSADLPCRRLH